MNVVTSVNSSRQQLLPSSASILSSLGMYIVPFAWNEACLHLRLQQLQPSSAHQAIQRTFIVHRCPLIDYTCDWPYAGGGATAIWGMCTTVDPTCWCAVGWWTLTTGPWYDGEGRGVYAAMGQRFSLGEGVKLEKAALRQPCALWTLRRRKCRNSATTENHLLLGSQIGLFTTSSSYWKW